MDDRRGKRPGSTAARIARGAAAARAPDAVPVDTVLDVRAALRHALAGAQPGDLVVLGCASHLDDLRDALGSVDVASIDIASLLSDDAHPADAPEPAPAPADRESAAV